jgi:hypothetical protein
VLVSITSQFELIREPNELRVQNNFHLHYRASKNRDSVFLLCFFACPISIEWTDQFIYLRDQDLIFCNIFAYDRLAYGHMLLIEHVWLMNRKSIANGIVYGSESMKIEPYIILIFFI